MLLTALVGPIIDKVLPRFFSDKDKRLEARSAIEQQLQANEHSIETAIVNAQRDIIVADAKGESWLQRSWRPIVVLTFTALIVAYQLGLTDGTRMTDIYTEGLLDIVKLALSGFIVSRGAEKVTKQLYPHGRDK